MAANNFEQVKTYPSPNVGDLIFFEYVDSNIAIHQRPEYGTLHRNQALFPGYKLVLIDAADDSGRQKWFYAADRIEQEEHNWQVSYPYAGITTAPRFSCTFIIPRDSYSPLAKGSAHPLDDGDETPDAFVRFKDAKLVFETQVSVGFKEIDSLYIGVQRVYDKIPTLGEQLIHNIDTTYPYAGLKDFPRRTRSLIVPLQGFAPVAKGTADPIYTGAKLIDEAQVTPNDETIKSLYVVVRRVYDEIASITEQETFNATIEYPYLSDTRFPRTTRRYVIPRANLGTAVIPSTGLDLGGATLAFRRVDRFEGQPEDSLYVLVTVAHDRIPNLATTEEATFLKGFGYQITRPYGTDDHPRLTWRIPLVKAGFVLTPEYTACPITGYTGLLLTDESAEADPNNASNITIVRVYDSLPGPELENEVREKLAGIPEGFIATRTTETLRQPVKNDATIASVTGLPDALGGGVLKTQLGPNGNNTVTHEKGQVKITVETGPKVYAEYDELTGTIYNITEEIVPAGTAGAGLDPTTGLFSTVKQIDQYYAIKTTRRPTALGTGDDAISYETVKNWYWPPVLTSLTFYSVERRDGQLYKVGQNMTFQEGYNGPCKAVITDSWSATPVSAPTITPMIETPMNHDFATVSVRVPACLHPAITLTEVIGTSHPVLKFATIAKTFLATNYTQWPNTIVAAFDQQPYRGGYRIQSIVIHKPA